MGHYVLPLLDVKLSNDVAARLQSWCTPQRLIAARTCLRERKQLLRNLVRNRPARRASNGADQFAAQVRTESGRWAKAIKDIGLKVD
jgi:hypothetical protein